MGKTWEVVLVRVTWRIALKEQTHATEGFMRLAYAVQAGQFSDGCLHVEEAENSQGFQST